LSNLKSDQPENGHHDYRKHQKAPQNIAFRVVKHGLLQAESIPLGSQKAVFCRPKGNLLQQKKPFSFAHFTSERAYSAGIKHFNPAHFILQNYVLWLLIPKISHHRSVNEIHFVSTNSILPYIMPTLRKTTDAFSTPVGQRLKKIHPF